MDNEFPPQIIEMVLLDEADFDGHALIRMAEFNLSVEDAVEAILNGWLYKAEQDRVSGMRYTIIGPGVDGRLVYTVGKIKEGSDGPYYYFITVKRDQA